MKRLGILYSPLDGMLVHRRVTPSIKFAGTNLHLGGERHCASKVSCPRTQRNVPGQGSNPERSRTNHEETALPHVRAHTAEIMPTVTNRHRPRKFCASLFFNKAQLSSNLGTSPSPCICCPDNSSYLSALSFSTWYALVSLPTSLVFDIQPTLQELYGNSDLTFCPKNSP